jgi:hypothetical protein
MKSLIGAKICDIRYSSFIQDSKIVSKMVTVYLKTDTGTWFEVIIGDGALSIEEERVEPELSELSKIDFDFAYPISQLGVNKDFENTAIVNVEKLLWDGQEDECCGVLLSFENGKQMSFVEKNDSITILNGVDGLIVKRCDLKKYYDD